MKYIELVKNDDENDSLIAVIDESQLRTDFDTGKTRIIVAYYKGPKENEDKLTEVRLTLGDSYIADKYHLDGEVSDDDKIKAALEAGKEIFDDKGIPYSYGGAIFTSGHQIVYSAETDMQGYATLHNK